ncbi:hypothetical protein QOT17_000699 [Balamuthia mandrillaris]
MSTSTFEATVVDRESVPSELYTDEEKRELQKREACHAWHQRFLPVITLHLFVGLVLLLVLQSFTPYLGGRSFQKLDHVHMTPLTTLHYVRWSFIPVVAAITVFLLHQFAWEWVLRKVDVFPRWSRYSLPALICLHIIWLLLYQFHKFIAAEVFALISVLYLLPLVLARVRYGAPLELRAGAWPWMWQQRALQHLRREKPRARRSRLAYYYTYWRGGRDERGTTRVSPEMARLMDLNELRKDKYAGYRFLFWTDSLIYLPFSVALAHFLYVACNNLFIILHDQSNPSYQDLRVGAIITIALLTLIASVVLIVCQDVVMASILVWIFGAIARRQYLTEEHDLHDKVVLTAIICGSVLAFFVIVTLINLIVQTILLRPRALWNKGRYLVDEEDPLRQGSASYYDTFEQRDRTDVSLEREENRERRRQYRAAGTDLEKEELLSERAAEREIVGIRPGAAGMPTWTSGRGVGMGMDPGSSSPA